MNVSTALWFPVLDNWSEREDSNLRPLEPHSSTLPNCATPRPRYYMPFAEFSQVIAYKKADARQVIFISHTRLFFCRPGAAQYKIFTAPSDDSRQDPSIDKAPYRLCAACFQAFGRVPFSSCRCCLSHGTDCRKYYMYAVPAF